MKRACHAGSGAAHQQGTRLLDLHRPRSRIQLRAMASSSTAQNHSARSQRCHRGVRALALRGHPVASRKDSLAAISLFEQDPSGADQLAVNQADDGVLRAIALKMRTGKWQ